MAQVLSDALRVEVGLGSTPLTALSSVSWTDVTSSVMLSAGVNMNRGRSGYDTVARPGTLSFTLDNSKQAGTEGRFTPGGTNMLSGWGLRIPVRVRARYPYGGATYIDLWYGYIETVEVDWDNGFRPIARVTASDRLARLEQRKLPGLIRGVQLRDAPSALWVLDDASGSTVGGDQSGNSVTALTKTAHGSPSDNDYCDFGAAAGPGPDGQKAVALGGLYDDANYYQLYAGISGNSFFNTTSQTFEMYVYSPSVWPQASATVYIGAGASYGHLEIDLRFDASPYVRAYLYNGAYNMYADSTTKINTNEWTHVVVVVSYANPTTTAKLYVNGTLKATSTYNFTNPLGVAGPQSPWIALGDSIFNGRLANVALYPTALTAAQITEHAAVRDTLNSYTSETATAKFTRICQIAGLPATEYQVVGSSTATMSPFPVAGTTLLNAANECAKADLGVIYLNRSGALTFATAASRSGVSSSFTLPGSSIDKGTSFVYDMTQVTNSATITRPGGITVHKENATSVAAYDTHDYNATVYVATDAQASSIADYWANTLATPQVRVTDIKVDLVTQATPLAASMSSILQADVGTKFTVNGLPSASRPASSTDLFVEGVQDSVTATSWVRSFVANKA